MDGVNALPAPMRTTYLRQLGSHYAQVQQLLGGKAYKCACASLIVLGDLMACAQASTPTLHLPPAQLNTLIRQLRTTMLASAEFNRWG